METTSEYTGDTAMLIILVLVCFPAGIYYYFTNKEEQVVCPECRETADTGASVCPNCNEDLGGSAGGTTGGDDTTA